MDRAPHCAPPEQLRDRGNEIASRSPGAVPTAPVQVRTHCAQTGALTLGGKQGGQRAQATTSPGAPNPDRELGTAHVRPIHRDEGQPGRGTGAQQAPPR